MTVYTDYDCYCDVTSAQKQVEVVLSVNSKMQKEQNLKILPEGFEGQLMEASELLLSVSEKMLWRVNNDFA